MSEKMLERGRKETRTFVNLWGESIEDKQDKQEKAPKLSDLVGVVESIAFYGLVGWIFMCLSK